VFYGVSKELGQIVVAVPPLNSLTEDQIKKPRSVSRNRRSKDFNATNFGVKKRKYKWMYKLTQASHTIFYIQLKNSGQIVLTLLNFENRCCTNQPRENLMKEIKTLENTKINPVAYLCLKRLLLKMRQRSHIFHKKVNV